MTSNIATLFVLAIALLTPIALAAEPTAVTVGTYAYKGIDREAAVTPLAEAAGQASQSQVGVKVLSSPSELTQAFLRGEVQIVVPNLTGFAQIAAASDTFVFLFTPDNKGSTYSSSVVTWLPNPELTKKQSENTLVVGMVWPDSTSGGILGSHYLQQINALPSNEEKLKYLGSHNAVMEALSNQSIELGVLATDVYRKSPPQVQLREVWRSDLIPYGPVICSESVKDLCEKLFDLTKQDPAIASAILSGLQQGWVEFENATELVTPTAQSYEAYVNHWRSKAAN